jgi:peptide-methionine (S)-S-oxide reductase
MVKKINKVPTEKAYLGGGCFWCLEASFKLLPGVTAVVSGYSGGKAENPNYEQVSTGATGHVETVEIEYDPTVTNYSALLDLFFKLHDPSQKDRQGNDVGTQYRSAIFYVGDEQKMLAQDYIKALEISGEYKHIYSELSPLTRFWPAEEYHQNYFAKHPEQAYCQAVVRAKVEKTMEYLNNDKAD